jgi:hypothetical protein
MASKHNDPQPSELGARIAVDDLAAIIREELYPYVNASFLAIPRVEVGLLATRIARRAIIGR